MILHGEDERVVNLAEIKVFTPVEMETLLRSLYPSMPERIILYFSPLVRGNIKHIAVVRTSNKPIEELEHKEWVLGVGRGFYWLHVINTAFIIGPFDPNLSAAIETAANLLKSNINNARINPNGIVLLTSAAYRDAAGPEHNLAREKALFLSKFALDIIKQMF